jgi:hypothetical protein
MSGRRYEIASYLARVRLLLQARAEARPVADLLPRGDLERVQIGIRRCADIPHAEIRRNGRLRVKTGHLPERPGMSPRAVACPAHRWCGPGPHKPSPVPTEPPLFASEEQDP